MNTKPAESAMINPLLSSHSGSTVEPHRRALPVLPQLNGISGDPKILPDGSQQYGNVVRLEILNREIWFDLEQHQVIGWKEADGSFHYPPSGSAEGGGCGSCGGAADAAAGDKPLPAESARAKAAYAMGEELDAINCVELHVNDMCNFRCDYCYLKSAGNEYLENEMPVDVATKSVDFMLAQVPAGRTGVVRFFGGEPLLSYGLMKQVIEYAEDKAREQNKKVTFMVNTNGSLLNNEKIEWLQRHRFKVNISIDGNRESNNQHRKFVSGNGTWDTAIKKAKLFLEKAGYLNIRSTITDGSFQLKESMLEFSKLGGASAVTFQTECNLVGEPQVDAVDALSLMREHEELALALAEKVRQGEKLGYVNFMEPMFRSYHSLKSSYRCGAARTMVAISPKGKMYPCHRFVDVHDTEMGDVDNGLNGKMIQEFKENRVEFKQPCSECWARHFCGGGCAFNNYFTNANIEDPNNVHCKMFRHQVKLGLYLFTDLPSMRQNGSATKIEG
jgi:uncharacterized protein